MLPIDSPKVRLTAPVYVFGYFSHDVEGFVYSLEDRPFPDVVTFDAGKDKDGRPIEIEMQDPRFGTYGTPNEDSAAQALYAESKTVFTQHRLEEAFIEWHAGRREAAREHAGELRRVG